MLTWVYVFEWAAVFDVILNVLLWRLYVAIGTVHGRMRTAAAVLPAPHRAVPASVAASAGPATTLAQHVRRLFLLHASLLALVFLLAYAPWLQAPVVKGVCAAMALCVFIVVKTLIAEHAVSYWYLCGYHGIGQPFL